MRIASLLPGATELLFALGLGESVIGVSHDCDYPADVDLLPALTSTNVNIAASSAAIDAQVKSRAVSEQPLYKLDADRLADLAPDLIVTQAQCDVCAVSLHDVSHLVASHPALGSTRVFPLDPCSFDELVADIHRLGRATHRVDRAEELCREMASRTLRVREGVRGLPRPRVACVEWIEPLMIAGNGVPQLIEMAGGDPILTVAGEPSRYCDWSELLARKPQVGIIAPCGFDVSRTLLELDRSTVDAWRQLVNDVQCRSYLMDGNVYLNRIGPRLVDSVEIMAHIFHPQVFQKPPFAGFEQLLPGVA